VRLLRSRGRSCLGNLGPCPLPGAPITQTKEFSDCERPEAAPSSEQQSQDDP
jgi:hypothetical protein